MGFKGKKYYIWLQSESPQHTCKSKGRIQKKTILSVSEQSVLGEQAHRQSCQEGPRVAVPRSPLLPVAVGDTGGTSCVNI